MQFRQTAALFDLVVASQNAHHLTMNRSITHGARRDGSPADAISSVICHRNALLFTWSGHDASDARSKQEQRLRSGSVFMISVPSGFQLNEWRDLARTAAGNSCRANVWRYHRTRHPVAGAGKNKTSGPAGRESKIRRFVAMGIYPIGCGARSPTIISL